MSALPCAHTPFGTRLARMMYAPISLICKSKMYVVDKRPALAMRSATQSKPNPQLDHESHYATRPVSVLIQHEEHLCAQQAQTVPLGLVTVSCGLNPPPPVPTPTIP